MPIPLEFRGAKEGKCNICGEFGLLTEDHTPPKGCYRPTAMEVQHLHQALSAEPSRKYKTNNGVKFRSLCARCNNYLLGAIYDPALIEFSKRVSTTIMSRYSLPTAFSVKGKPNKIARSIFGHLAAAKVDGFGTWKGYETLKEWFVSGSGELPEDLRLYYWLYPYKPQILVRGFGFTPQFGTISVFVGWLLKFYPLGFLFATNEDGYTLNLPNMSSYAGTGLDAELELPLHWHPLQPPHWPEAYVGEDGVVLSGDHAMHSTERPIRR